MDYAFIDCETGGLDAKSCALLEIGLVMLDGATLDEYHAFATRVAFDPARRRVEPGAAAVNGYRPELWRGAPEPAEALWLLCECLPPHGARWAAGGHNKSFDWRFLDAASRETGVVLPRPTFGVDVMYLARASLGVVNTAPHRALGDARAAADCYREGRRRGLWLDPEDHARARPTLPGLAVGAGARHGE